MAPKVNRFLQSHDGERGTCVLFGETKLLFQFFLSFPLFCHLRSRVRASSSSVSVFCRHIFCCRHFFSFVFLCFCRPKCQRLVIWIDTRSLVPCFDSFFSLQKLSMRNYEMVLLLLLSLLLLVLMLSSLFLRMLLIHSVFPCDATQTFRKILNPSFFLTKIFNRLILFFALVVENSSVMTSIFFDVVIPTSHNEKSLSHISTHLK